MSFMESQASELKLSEFGQRGGVLLTDTTAVTGKFRRIYAITDATFTVLTSEFTTNGTATASVGSDFGTLKAGLSISGKFTAVTLATGSVLLYK